MKFSPFLTTVAGFLAGVGTTQALTTLSKRVSVGGVSLSSQCENAIAGIAGNQDANSCLNIQTLVGGILTLSGNSSAVPPINAWLEGLCAATPCSNATLNAIASNITSGCQSDIGSADSNIGMVVQALPQIYPTLQEILCLKSTSNDTLCVSNLLLGFQDSQGTPLSVSSATGTITQITGQAKNNTLPKNLLCTDCNRAALGVLIKNDPSIGNNSQFQSTVASQCGNDFLSAPSPTNVAEGTGSAAPTGTLPAQLGSDNNNTSGATAILAGVFTSTSIALFAGLYTIVA